MMKRPIVSVIMPVYNAEKYIAKTIDCILNQTYDNFELLLIVDCPTDNTMDVVSKIYDDRIRIIQNTTNMGIAYSRNKGIDEAKGKYIALMDNDDLCPPDRFEKSVEYLEEHNDIGVVGGGIALIDEEDNPIGEPVVVKCNADEIWADIVYQCPLPNSSTMIRKEIIDDYNIRYQDHMLGMEDYRFWMEVSLYTKIFSFEDIFLFWRVSSEAETTRVKTMLAQKRAKVFAEIQKFGLERRGVELDTPEWNLFFNAFDEEKQNDNIDMDRLYILMRKMYNQILQKFPEKQEALLYVFRNRYIEVARRCNVHAKEALEKNGFGIKEYKGDEPLVSVIIPTYNREDQIEMSVQSVLKQTYTNIEIIISDDCSTDNTEEVARRLASGNAKVKYYKTPHNGGPAKARNYAFQYAQGEYIAFHDDDDEWHPDKLEIQMTKMLSDDSIDMTFGKMVRYYENQCLGIVDEDFDWDRKKDNFPQEILMDNYVGAPTIVIKREAFDRIGGFCEEIPSIEDWEFAIRAALELKVEFIPTPLMDIHVNSLSVTHNFLAYVESWCYLLKKYIDCAEDRQAYIVQMIKHVRGNTFYMPGSYIPKAIAIAKKELVPDPIVDEFLLEMAFDNQREKIEVLTAEIEHLQDDVEELRAGVKYWMNIGASVENLKRYKNVATKLLEPEKVIAQWLIENNYFNISIYGVGRLGKCLYERVQDTSINIVKLIDQNPGQYKGHEIVDLDAFVEDIGETDVVIVTPLYIADEIGKELQSKSGVKYISIEHLMNM